MHLNNRDQKYMKQTLTEMKREIHNSTTIVRDLIPYLQIMDTTTRQQINKKIEEYYEPTGPISYLQNIHPTTAEYTFFLGAHGTFSRIDHMLGHKTNLNKSLKIEIIQNTFSNHNQKQKEI